jgi:hypothetical protein
MPSPRPPALYPHTPASGARAILHLSCSKFGLIILLTTRISPTTTLFVHLTALSHSHCHPRDHNHGLRRLCSYCTYIPPPPRRLLAWPFYSSTPRCNVGISATLCFLASRTPRLSLCSHIIPIHPRATVLLRVHKVRPGILIGAYRVGHAHTSRSAPPFFLL